MYVERPASVIVHESLAAKRWLDVTFQTRTYKVMLRWEQRFNRGGEAAVAIGDLDRCGGPHSMDCPRTKRPRTTSDCDAMRVHGHQMALLTSECAPDSDPMVAVEKFLGTYPQCSTVLLADDDVRFFLDLCMSTRNGKVRSQGTSHPSTQSLRAERGAFLECRGLRGEGCSRG